MNQLENDINDRIRKLLELDDIDEMSVTGALDGGEAPPKSPRMFKKTDGKDEDEESDVDLNTTGFSKKKVKHLNTESDILLQQLEDQININEMRYTDFKKDDTKSTNQKLNDSIRMVNSKLLEIERTCRHHLKLKTETGSSNKAYWKSTRTKMQKIDERINKLSTLMRKFYE